MISKTLESLIQTVIFYFESRLNYYTESLHKYLYFIFLEAMISIILIFSLSFKSAHFSTHRSSSGLSDASFFQFSSHMYKIL